MSTRTRAGRGGAGGLSPAVLARLARPICLARRGRSVRLIRLACLVGALLVLSSRSISAGSAPHLLELKFTGNESVSPGDLRDVVRLRRGDILTDSAVGMAVSAVTGLYRERSRYGAVVAAAARRVQRRQHGRGPALHHPRGCPRHDRRDRIPRTSVHRARSGRGGVRERSGGAARRRRGSKEGLAALLAECERSGFPFAEASIADISGGADGAMTVAVDDRGGGARHDRRDTGRGKHRNGPRRHPEGIEDGPPGAVRSRRGLAVRRPAPAARALLLGRGTLHLCRAAGTRAAGAGARRPDEHVRRRARDTPLLPRAEPGGASPAGWPSG